jgi:hypothetical protein
MLSLLLVNKNLVRFLKKLLLLSPYTTSLSAMNGKSINTITMLESLVSYMVDILEINTLGEIPGSFLQRLLPNAFTKQLFK